MVTQSLDMRHGPEMRSKETRQGALDNGPTPSRRLGAPFAPPAPFNTNLLLQSGGGSRAILGSLSLHAALHPAEPGGADSACLQRQNSLHVH